MDKDKAYVSDNLYLPKSQLRLAGVVSSLEFKIPSKDKSSPSILKLWKDGGEHIIVPRHYIPESKFHKYKFPFINQQPAQWPIIKFKSDICWRNGKQAEAFKAIFETQNGVLNLNTGKGKTVIALERIVSLAMPALIVVHNSYLKEQWLERIYNPKINLQFTGGVGLIEGPIMRWKHPITIAMIETLANRFVDNALPEGFREWFGVTFYDEVHHLSAPTFSKSASVCLGQRFGLTATPRRADGLDCIVKYHIGDVFYSDMSYDLIPEITFIKTPIVIKKTKWDNLWSLVTRLSKDPRAIEVRYQHLKKAYDEGRKIIAISSRKELLDTLASRFTDSCLITSDTDVSSRTKLVQKSRIIFAIGRLGLEGLDDENLDTIFFLTPIGGDKTITEDGKEFLGNQVRQGFGRILRDNGKQKFPKAFFFDDEMEEFNMLNGQVKQFLLKNDFPFRVLK